MMSQRTKHFDFLGIKFAFFLFMIVSLGITISGEFGEISFALRLIGLTYIRTNVHSD